MGINFSMPLQQHNVGFANSEKSYIVLFSIGFILYFDHSSCLTLAGRSLIDYARNITYYSILLFPQILPTMLFNLPIIPVLFPVFIADHMHKLNRYSH